MTDSRTLFRRTAGFLMTFGVVLALFLIFADAVLRAAGGDSLFTGAL